MKLRTTAIATIFLALILSASPLGYCYSNIVAAKTTDDVSDYESMTRIGISPGAQLDIAGRTVLGTSAVAGLGTFYVLFVSGKAAAVAPVSAQVVPAEIELAEAVHEVIPEGVRMITYSSGPIIDGEIQVEATGTCIWGTDFTTGLSWGALKGPAYEALGETALNFASEEAAEGAAEGAGVVLPGVASVASPFIVPLAIAAGITIVVILVTVTCAYIWWSCS
jgi:hypothetical protein